MKSPKLPAVVAPPPPPAAPPPVTVRGTESAQAATDAKRRAKSAYSYDKTILRAGGLSAAAQGTSPTLGS